MFQLLPLRDLDFGLCFERERGERRERGGGGREGGGRGGEEEEEEEEIEEAAFCLRRPSKDSVVTAGEFAAEENAEEEAESGDVARLVLIST